MALTLADKFNTRDALTFETQACRARARQYGQIMTMLDWSQKCLGRIPTKTGSLIDFEIATAFVVAAIEIWRRRNTRLSCGIPKRIQNFPGQPRGLHTPLAPCTMKRTPTRVMVFHPFKQREHIIPAPTFITQRSPTIVVCTLATHINHAVNRRAAAKHTPARITQLATVKTRISLGAIAPVCARVTDTVQIPHRDMNPVPVIWPTRFKQQNAIIWIGGKAIGQ